jgi:hypothetical protein
LAILDCLQIFEHNLDTRATIHMFLFRIVD